MASGVRKTASFSSCSCLFALLFRNSRAGYLGWSKIKPSYSKLFSSIHASRFKSTFNFPKEFVHGFTSPGKRILTGCFTGMSMAAATMCDPTNIAYAWHDVEVESSGGDVTEDFNTLWALARKYQLPLVMLILLLLGWRHPVITAINAVFFLFCTCPSPFSIYLVVEHMRRREMHRDPSLSKTKLLYTKKIEVEDYKLFCHGKVELQDRELHLIGILGGWWIFYVSHS